MITLTVMKLWETIMSWDAFCQMITFISCGGMITFIVALICVGCIISDIVHGKQAQQKELDKETSDEL